MRLTLISYAPDPAPHLIPAGMIQRTLIKTNDAIIEIRNIESAIGAQLDMHRPEPGILAQQKIMFHLANRTGTVIRGGVAVNAAGHDIANEKIIPVLFREKHICVASNPSQGSCLPFQGFHIRRKAHSHFLSPLRIIASRSEEHTSELQSLMRISYAVFCLTKKKHKQTNIN